MVESENNSEDVSWRVAVQVWWAGAWRVALLSLTIGAIPRILLNSWPELGKAAIGMVVIAVEIWATRRSLRVRYPTFSIIIKHELPG